MVKVDVDRDEKTAYAYRIKSIPRTVVLNVYGEIIGDMVGFMPADEFLVFLKDVKVDALKKVDGTVITVPADVPGNTQGEPLVSENTEADELLELVCAQKIAIRKAAQAELLTRDAQTIDQLIKALLGSDYLGARIAGTRLLTQQQPGTAKAFDP